MELNYRREDLCYKCSTTVLHGLQKSLSSDYKFVPNSLARNASDLLPCLSDGFGFLLFNGETVGPDACVIGSLSIISKVTVLQDDNSTIANARI